MRLHAAPDDAGLRLDAFLAEPVGSRARAQKLIDAGAVTVDGVRAIKSRKLEGDELVVVDADRDPDRVEDVAALEGPPAPYAVAWEDPHLLVVDKPAGVVVHPSRGHRHGTLAQALADRGATGGEDPWRAGIVHRLDRDTSGLLVVAKDEDVHRALKELLGRREIMREYVALVEGRPPARTGTIDAPIGRDRRVRTRQSTDTDDPRDAVTHFELEEALSRHTLLRVRLETGRTHQIRVHLQAIGHPVAGDPEYGPAPPSVGPAALGLERQFLHAARLAFAHPVTGEDVDVASPLPEDLSRSLDRARAL
jgi:23S rRNA pseudouridine1911/1915/1917 synthase